MGNEIVKIWKKSENCSLQETALEFQVSNRRSNNSPRELNIVNAETG